MNDRIKKEKRKKEKKKKEIMKFYIEKGKVNEVKATQDKDEELMFLITLTESQVKDLCDGKIVGLKER